MTKSNRTIALLLLATAALAPVAQATTVYTPGYFVDQVSWEKTETSAYRYYLDYNVEQISGHTPSISPYIYSGQEILSATFAVTDNGTTSAGRYVKSWNGYVHSTTHSYSSPKFSYSGPKYFTLTSDMMKGSSYLDIIPCLCMMTYKLKYDKNDGTWISEPTEKTHIWSNSVTFAAASTIKRNGYDYQGWNTRQDGSGLSVTPGQTTIGGQTLKIDNSSVDENGFTNITLYAQWSVKSYALHLRLGNGIKAIYHKVNGATSWTKVTADADVDVRYDTVWYAYAEAEDGYTYTKYTASAPYHDTIKLDSSGEKVEGGNEYAPAAEGLQFEVVFFGNGETSGSTAAQYFNVGVPKTLSKNGYVRTYRIEFDSKAGTSVPAKESQAYKFLNWKDSTGKYTYTDQQEVTNPCDSKGERVELYAQWSKDEASFFLPTTEKDGSAFSGWYADYACESEFVGNAGDSYTPTNNTTLYAKWTTKSYTVRFYHADETVASEQQVAYRESATPPTPDEKQYYKFSNWDTDAWKEVVEDLDVHPEYNAKNYRFVYHSNYNNGQTELSEEGISCNKDKSPQAVPVFSSSYLDYAKTGYSAVEDGWNTDPDSLVAKYKPTASLEIAGNDWIRYTKLDTAGNGNEKVDIYAIWSPNSYKVKFEKGADEATGAMDNQSFVYDTPQALTKNAFQYDGQEFQHWEDAVSHRVYENGEIVSNLTATADGTVTLTAVWSNYHYVRFHRNGATNETEMALQKFSGAETNALSPNAYGKIGYSFAGWATNLVDAAKLVVTYTNCQEAAFPDARANETNVLYAVWATNHYTIAFDPGPRGRGLVAASTGRYFFGTMEPITNCAYDTAITVKCGYTNYCSKGLVGWSTNENASVTNFFVLGTSPVTRGSDVDVVNLTAVDGATQTLYAVWADAGELSAAAALTNAVLFSNDGSDTCSWRPATQRQDYDWDRGHDPRVACEYTGDYAGHVQRTLQMKVVGGGTLRFHWCSRLDNENNASFNVMIDSLIKTNLYAQVEGGRDKKYWDDPVALRIEGSGEHVVMWALSAKLCKADVIAIDDVVWTPGEELKPGEEMPTYETKEEAEAAAQATTVARPNAEVEAVVSAQDYNAMFDVKAVPVDAANGGDWTLAIQLKESVSNEVQTALNEAETNLCSVITNNPISVSVAMKPGLYYGLAATNEVEWLSLAVPAEWVLGGSGSTTVSAPRPSETEAFYELRMAITKPNQK